MGYCLADAVNRTAQIRIRRWEDFMPAMGESMDQRCVIIHELCHCVFDDLWTHVEKNTFVRDALHQKIDIMAWALVDAQRESEDKVKRKRRPNA